MQHPFINPFFLLTSGFDLIVHEVDHGPVPESNRIQSYSLVGKYISSDLIAEFLLM